VADKYNIRVSIVAEGFSLFCFIMNKYIKAL